VSCSGQATKDQQENQAAGEERFSRQFSTPHNYLSILAFKMQYAKAHSVFQGGGQICGKIAPSSQIGVIHAGEYSGPH
jgi:hypothetical protein